MIKGATAYWHTYTIYKSRNSVLYCSTFYIPVKGVERKLMWFYYWKDKQGVEFCEPCTDPRRDAGSRWGIDYEPTVDVIRFSSHDSPEGFDSLRAKGLAKGYEYPFYAVYPVEEGPDSEDVKLYKREEHIDYVKIMEDSTKEEWFIIPPCYIHNLELGPERARRRGMNLLAQYLIGYGTYATKEHHLPRRISLRIQHHKKVTHTSKALLHELRQEIQQAWKTKEEGLWD